MQQQYLLLLATAAHPKLAVMLTEMPLPKKKNEAAFEMF